MRIRGIATIAGGIVLAGVTLWIVGRGTAPRATLLLGGAPLTNQFVDTPAGTRLTVSLDIDRSYHAYVFVHHPTDGSACYFPSDGLRTDIANPLAAGSHTLPGRDPGPGNSTGRAITWPGPASLGATDVVLVVSEAPVGELERLAAQVRQASNRVFPDGSEAVLTLPAGTAAEQILRTATWPDPLLADAAAAPGMDDHMRPVPGRSGLWSAAWKLVVREQLPLDEQLRESFGPLQGGVEPARPK